MAAAAAATAAARGAMRRSEARRGGEAARRGGERRGVIAGATSRDHTSNVLSEMATVRRDAYWTRQIQVLTLTKSKTLAKDGTKVVEEVRV